MMLAIGFSLLFIEVVNLHITKSMFGFKCTMFLFVFIYLIPFLLFSLILHYPGFCFSCYFFLLAYCLYIILLLFNITLEQPFSTMILVRELSPNTLRLQL